MKKTVSLLLALFLLLLPTLSFAEEGMKNVKWSQIEQSVKDNGIEGEFRTLSDVSLKFWIPSFMQETPSEREDVLAQFTMQNAAAVVVQRMPAEAEGETLESLAEEFKQNSDASEVELAVVNDLPALAL